MASGSTALGTATKRPVTKPLEQYVDDLTVNFLTVVGPSGGVIADECRPSKVDEGGLRDRIDQTLPSWDFRRSGPRSEMANVRSIPPCRPTRFRPGWERVGEERGCPFARRIGGARTQ